MSPSNVPSTAEAERRKLIDVNAETVAHVSSTDFPGHYPGEDNAFSLDAFRDGLSIKVHTHKQHNMSFSVIGIDASIANAIRRIIIAEISTLAIEAVFYDDNTSVIQDEVLAHRLGLIPFKGGKEGLLNFIKDYKKPEPGEDIYANLFDYNTVCLRLDVQCTHNPDAAEDETDPDKLYNHANVYARDLQFVPSGRQSEYFSGENAIAPVNPDILIAKLRPPQAIKCEVHMHKGLGSDHAKFSPVCPATYRLMPVIDIKKPILGADALKFQKCFPKGVIGLEPVSAAESSQVGSGYEGHEGERKAVVLDAMKDTVSRECLRHPEFKDKVQLGRKRDHFIYSIESSGQWDSEDLFLEALVVLKRKCQILEKQVVGMCR
ncbi:DNA-directed RNA polymerase core subunit rpc40 [Ceratocystis pirilliformis]|uniref:DNA-directed RNA polymerases I and III subunit RPAC1 n=1 Tax=Ceratocystis pirilliformis TaxID=259994 RepID=A0ABR3Z1D7_9PEZI